MQVTVKINNSTSQVTGLEPKAFQELRKLLSYQVDAQASFFAGSYKPRVKHLIDVKGTFLTGLLPRTLDFLLAKDIKFNMIDTRQRPTRVVNHRPLSAIRPYPWQADAVDLMEQNSRGIVSASTGTGKSLVIALIMARLCVKTLIVVPNLELKRQLTTGLLERFGDMSNITVENIDSNALNKATDYDCLIIDEAHHSVARTYQQLNRKAWNSIYWRFYLTATPFRTKQEEDLALEGIAGQIIYKLSYQEAIRNSYIVPVEAYYLEMPKVEVAGYTWAQVYSELVVNNKDRNLRIAVLLARLNAAQKPTLCLVKEVAHGKALEALTGIPFVSGQDDESRDYIRQFNNGEFKALIGTEGVIGEGVDTKPCEYVIIAGLGKAKAAFQQKVGRGVRTFPGKVSAKIVLIYDKSHKFTKNHFNEQKKILREEYNVIPLKLEL